MITKVRSMGLTGITGTHISVECFLSGGMPSVDIVGLPDTAVKESKERVRAAIKSSGLEYPKGRVTLNLAPADIKKEGTVYDLPILLGIISSMGAVRELPQDSAFLGELSLSGKLRPIKGVLPMALAAPGLGIKKLYVPPDNAAEATLADGIEVYPVEDVGSLVAHLRGEKAIEPAEKWSIDKTKTVQPDFADVLGQENVKRALEIAAAGNHNILLIGPPGSGKSMLFKRLASILPDMTREESLEVTKIYSVAGLTDRENPVINIRPFRSPHHTASPVSLSGGGSNIKPGEVSLAHNGVLFLDELPEFSKVALETLRQPMEDGEVLITRASGSVRYPSRFMLACAMNPCKCGWYGQKSRECICSENAVKSYVSRVSGPLLDRIDMRIEVAPVEYKYLAKRNAGESSASIRERVNAAREIQNHRYKSGTATNASLDSSGIKEHCSLDSAGETIMREAFEKLSLTARSYDRVLKVARTIADLAGCEKINAMHIAEAVSYRSSALLNL